MRISDWSSDVCSSDLAHHCRPRSPSSIAYRLGAEAAHRALPFMLGRKFQDNVRHALRDKFEARGPDALARAPFAANAPEARERLFEPVVPPAPFETPPQTMRVEDRAMRSEEHTSELQSLMRISYAVFS